MQGDVSDLSHSLSLLHVYIYIHVYIHIYLHTRGRLGSQPQFIAVAECIAVAQFIADVDTYIDN